MYELNVWDKITAYVAENERIADLEAEIQQMNNFKDSFKNFEENLDESHRLDTLFPGEISFKSLSSRSTA